MDNIKNLPKTEKDFELLNNICLNIVNETTYDDGRDWTQDEINLFVSQFSNEIHISSRMRSLPKNTTVLMIMLFKCFGNVKKKN